MHLTRRHLVAGFGLAAFPGACGAAPSPNEPGSVAPGFELLDFQPKSERFGESYGLDEFRGSVLLMPLYAGWCNTCVACADILNDVYLQWQAEGLNVRVCAINPSSAIRHQKRLVEVCDFALLQDTDDAKAWDALRGSKDDTYVYGPDGILRLFVDFTGDLSQMIVSQAGQARFRQAIVDAGG